MNPVFSNELLITKICSYLDPESIIFLSACNKTISEKLCPSNNPIINRIFNNEVTHKFFEMDEDYISENSRKKCRNNLLENSWKSKFNWKLFYSQMSIHFLLFPDKEITKMFLDSFKVHMYLLDLRKENFHLDYPHSSIYQMVCYDKKIKEICKYNYYGHYINDNYFNQNGGECTIKILREGLPFEKELKNFKTLYAEILANVEYKNVIELVNSYDFEKLNQIFKNNIIKNSVINIVIYFILWSNECFILYCKDILENVNNCDEYDEQKFLEELYNKYTNYVNTCLLIDSNFQNINIIVNYLNNYVLKKNTEEKFSLYDLATKIFRKTVLEKFENKGSKLGKIANKTSFLYINLLNNKINNKDEEINKSENNDSTDSNDDSDCDMSIDIDDDDYIDSFMKKTEKDVFENIINFILDLAINKNNGNAINHSKIILNKEYDEIENNIIRDTKDVIQNHIKKGEKTFLEIFEILEQLLKNDGNSRNLKKNPNSLKLINRTKRKLLDETLKYFFKLVFPIIAKDFNSRLKPNQNGRTLYVSNVEIMKKNTKNGIDLSEFSNSKQVQIEGKVQEEIKKIKTYLYEQNIYGYDIKETSKLVDEYLENDGIDYVLLMKKMLYFYCKENEIYEEKDHKIYNILSKRNNDDRNSTLNKMINI